MVLPIYLYGHPVLRTPTVELTPDYPGLEQLIANMKETMYESDGIGIAAPQVGKSLSTSTWTCLPTSFPN